MEQIINNLYKQELSREDFKRLSEAIYRVCGINLPESKKILIEGRLRKRMKSLGYDSYSSYINFLFSEKGTANELIPLIDVVTTNKTDFFRENGHFEYMVQYSIPEIFKNQQMKSNRKHLNIWSAGCSTGEEPYTMAIVLNEHSEINRDFTFTIFASDISTEVLKKAESGVFEKEKVEMIPERTLKKYFLRSKDQTKNLVRVTQEVRNQIRFSRINLIEGNYDFSEKMDLIFCRNVLIYFDKQTQERVISSLAKNLNKGGYLFLGHSESTMGMNLPLERASSTVYKKI